MIRIRMSVGHDQHVKCDKFALPWNQNRVNPTMDPVTAYRFNN